MIGEGCSRTGKQCRINKCYDKVKQNIRFKDLWNYTVVFYISCAVINRGIADGVGCTILEIGSISFYKLYDEVKVGRESKFQL